MAKYESGTLVRCSAAFVTYPGLVAADPTAVIFKYTDPSGATTTYTYAGGTVTKDGTGAYHVDLVPSVKGLYLYYFQGTGAVTASSEGNFELVGAF